MTAITTTPSTQFRTLCEHCTYPLLLLGLGYAVYWVIDHPQDLLLVTAIKGVVTVAVLLALELTFPLQRAWGPTWRLVLRRDAVLMAVNGASFGLLNYLFVVLAIDAAAGWQGAASGKPLWLQVIWGLLVFEALQYTVHRCLHLSGGPVTRFLWRSHAVHHLPQQLYLVMHIVFHPLNLVVLRVVVQLAPIWVFGFDPLAVFIYGSIIGLHGTLSHLNFDMRLGLFNYLFVGPELHRYHHSASSHEAVNFGAALSIYDLVLGTFKYTPGQYPAALGLRSEDGYPGQYAPLASLLFPFTGSSQSSNQENSRRNSA